MIFSHFETASGHLMIMGFHWKFGEKLTVGNFCPSLRRGNDGTLNLNTNFLENQHHFAKQLGNCGSGNP